MEAEQLRKSAQPSSPPGAFGGPQPGPLDPWERDSDMSETASETEARRQAQRLLKDFLENQRAYEALRVRFQESEMESNHLRAQLDAALLREKEHQQMLDGYHVALNSQCLNIENQAAERERTEEEHMNEMRSRVVQLEAMLKDSQAENLRLLRMECSAAVHTDSSLSRDMAQRYESKIEVLKAKLTEKRSLIRELRLHLQQHLYADNKVGMGGHLTSSNMLRLLESRSQSSTLSVGGGTEHVITSLLH